MKILEIDYHRNGVCGEGFHAVRFREGADAGPGGELEFLAMVFSREVYGVVCVTHLPEHGVGFNNHWRGDYYIDRLWKGIRRWERERDARWGPLGPGQPTSVGSECEVCGTKLGPGHTVCSETGRCCTPDCFPGCSCGAPPIKDGATTASVGKGGSHKGTGRVANRKKKA